MGLVEVAPGQLVNPDKIERIEMKGTATVVRFASGKEEWFYAEQASAILSSLNGHVVRANKAVEED